MRWYISLFTKTIKQKKFRKLLSNSLEWKATVSYIKALIPSICYFPTFLFEFPSRVYLSNVPEHSEPQNAYYRQIIQDVLSSIDQEFTIERHIIERVNKTDEAWSLDDYMQSDRKKQVEAVTNHLENAIYRSIFTRWNEMFGSKFTKNIKIDCNVDSNEQKPQIYLSFDVQDGVSTYSIAERSLGFRWFFCFLLFTQFRKSRSGSGTLFLFDEPASNLHATAQQQLLKSFNSVSEGNNSLIYSTHSHYMINPKWLESTFIVQNGAIAYDDELSSIDAYKPHKTDIQLVPYRRFVGENPDKSTYFQPILDAIDYSPSALEHNKGAVIVEGKSDFYVFTYFKEVIFKNKHKLHFLPSSGANDIGPLISLYLGWGYPFQILLDDDKAGKSARSRYMREWYLNNTVVHTIADLNGDFSKKKLENLISTGGKQLIATKLGIDKPTKKQILHFFQENLAISEKVEFDTTTCSNFESIFDKLSTNFEKNTAS